MASDIDRMHQDIVALRTAVSRLQIKFTKMDTLQSMHSCNPLKNPRLYVVVTGGSGGVFLLLNFIKGFLT